MKTLKENDDGGLILGSSQSWIKRHQTSMTSELFTCEFFRKKLLEDIIHLRKNNGTKFIILNQIKADKLTVDNRTTDDRNFVLSSLSGFTNTFKGIIKLLKL
jgi:hypothetical protein